MRPRLSAHLHDAAFFHRACLCICGCGARVTGGRLLAKGGSPKQYSPAMWLKRQQGSKLEMNACGDGGTICTHWVYFLLDFLTYLHLYLWGLFCAPLRALQCGTLQLSKLRMCPVKTVVPCFHSTLTPMLKTNIIFLFALSCLGGSEFLVYFPMGSSIFRIPTILKDNIALIDCSY